MISQPQVGVGGVEQCRNRDQRQGNRGPTAIDPFVPARKWPWASQPPLGSAALALSCCLLPSGFYFSLVYCIYFCFPLEALWHEGDERSTVKRHGEAARQATVKRRARGRPWLFLPLASVSPHWSIFSATFYFSTRRERTQESKGKKALLFGSFASGLTTLVNIYIYIFRSFRSVFLCPLAPQHKQASHAGGQGRRARGWPWAFSLASPHWLGFF